MDLHKEALDKTVQEVVKGVLDIRRAAEGVGVSHRTIHNYVRRFLDQGSEGLLDRRRGHFRKLRTEQEADIVSCKREKPHRSARWIRNYLKLPVSVETVRLVLVKHHLNRINNPAMKWLDASRSHKQGRFQLGKM
ncbi:MAG: helix-turn-helix domain-containing protein [Deltaproteobacteria bacterium]|nr:helix-turn-helix domain-containing protein [Deltaproteobacteria bacterium]